MEESCARKRAKRRTAMITAPTEKKMKLSELNAAEYNPRTVAPEALKGLRESVQAFGSLEMPVVNIHGGKKVIVSGHQRVKAMMAEGITHADCIIVDFDEVTEKIANVTMNNTAIQGTFDPVKALPLLDKIVAQLPMPNAMQFATLQDDIRKEVDRIMVRAQEKQASDIEAAQDTTKNVAEPVSVEGETYILGKHRLYCGSCEIGIPKLLGKKKAAACVSDPPYNVAYSTDAFDVIENDDMDAASWIAFVDMFTKVILANTDGPCYIFMSSKELPALGDAWAKNGGLISRWLIWIKDSFTLSRGDYHHQYEPCLYGHRSGLTISPPRNLRTNVLEFPKPKRNALHPTQKPVALIEALMADGSDPGDLIIEPFCGSGTTLVVAESMGRVCYASELDRMYVDTIRIRWANQMHGEGCDWQTLTPALQ